MFFTIHCGGIPFNGDTIKTQSLGGSETAAYYVALNLAKRGHKVTMFTNSQDEGTFDGVRYLWAGPVHEAAPLGERFHFYAENTPSECCIIQRHPQAFTRKLASKVNLLWLHDLALRRARGAINGQAWNIDAFLTVSEFHRQQVIAEWGIAPEFVKAIRNGIDPALFEPYRNMKREANHLLYSSRPERGLENLVKPGGIMERLPDHHLFVCGYDNTTPHMADYYRYLWDRCDALPNVTNLGALTKAQLAEVMSGCGALIYPTTFEEVSCITAMEAMVAGLPFVASEHAALPETCNGSGSYLIPLKDGKADEDRFVDFFTGPHDSMLSAMSEAQRAASLRFDWGGVAQSIEEIVLSTMAKSSRSSLMHHFIRHSDIPALEVAGLPDLMLHQVDDLSRFEFALGREYMRGYQFYRDNAFASHYRDYYQYEADRGINYGPEDVTGTVRYQAVAARIEKLPPGSRVLDYGCAHGHYTINLAKQFPALHFTGVDIALSNHEKACDWATAEGITNVNFVVDDATKRPLESVPDQYDAIIAAEVLEHVADPRDLLGNLLVSLKDGGEMVLTTPYGPWEAQGYQEHQYWRAHLHHFERADLKDMLGSMPGFNVIVAPSGFSKFATPLGSYVTTFTKPHGMVSIGYVDYHRKIRETAADQTLSVCMIVKDAEADIVRCLRSVVPYAQQIIIAVDEATKDRTTEVIDSVRGDYPLIDWQVFPGKPAAEIGFAAARNATIERADCDWVMWIDADEVLHGSPLHFLRNNHFSGYAIKQHHMSIDPLGVLKTDLPVRIFRNRIGARFFGWVHEHPEITMNGGLGNICLANGVQIIHHGYHDEGVRRGRFQRNITLLARDRRENPDRMLGKFLWIRDLAQMCQYDREAGAVNMAEFQRRAREGVQLWEEILEAGNTRLCVDALPYYSPLASLLGTGFDFGFTVEASKMNGGVHLDKAQRIEGHFHSKDAAFRLQQAITRDRVEGFDSRYF